MHIESKNPPPYSLFLALELSADRDLDVVSEILGQRESMQVCSGSDVDSLSLGLSIHLKKTLVPLKT